MDGGILGRNTTRYYAAGDLADSLIEYMQMQVVDHEAGYNYGTSYTECEFTRSETGVDWMGLFAMGLLTAADARGRKKKKAKNKQPNLI